MIFAALLEILAVLAGLVMMVSGKASIKPGVRLVGDGARAMGIWIMMYAPLSFGLYILLIAIWMKSFPETRTQFSEYEIPTSYLLASLFAPMVIIGCAVPVIFRRASRRTSAMYGTVEDTTIARSGNELGTFSDETISYNLWQGRLVGTDHYYRAGMADWRTLKKWLPRAAPAKGILITAMVAATAAVALFFGSSVYLVNYSAPGTTLDGVAISNVPLPSKPERAAKIEKPEKTESRHATAFPPATTTPPSVGSGIAPKTSPRKSPPAAYDDMEEAMNFGKLLAQELVNGGSPDAATALKKVADGGNATAQHEMGMACLMGRTPMAAGATFKKDPALAREWFTKAARQGHAASQLVLGAILKTGETGRKDPGEAWAWTELSMAKMPGSQKEKLMEGQHRAEQEMTAQEKEHGKAFLEQLRNEGVR